MVESPQVTGGWEGVQSSEGTEHFAPPASALLHGTAMYVNSQLCRAPWSLSPTWKQPLGHV